MEGNSETMQQTAEVPVSLPRRLHKFASPVNESCVFGTLRDWQVRFRAEGVRGEEALYRQSSVFGNGRSASRVAVSSRSVPFRCQSDSRSFHRPIARVRLRRDRKSTRLNSSHLVISYAVFCLKKKSKCNCS